MTKGVSAELFFRKEKLNQKKLKKGVSALIAAVILAAFTISAAFMAASFPAG